MKKNIILVFGCVALLFFSFYSFAQSVTLSQNQKGLTKKEVMPAYGKALNLYKKEFDSLTNKDIQKMELQAKKFHLEKTIENNGVLVFPHVRIKDDGYMLIAVIDAILKSKRKKVLLLNLTHSRTALLLKAHNEMGENPDIELPKDEQHLRGVFTQNSVWGGGHSTYEFKRMLKVIAHRRGVPVPSVTIRFISLTGVYPETLPRIKEIINDYRSHQYAVVSSGDLLHHGVLYGDNIKDVFPITDKKGRSILKARIKKSLQLLDQKRYKQFIKYSYSVTHSDWADVGVLIRYILGPTKSTILSVAPSDFSDFFKVKTPAYVLGALISINPIR